MYYEKCIFLTSQWLQAPDVIITSHTVCNNHCELAGDTCKEGIGLGSDMVPGMFTGKAHIDLKMVDGPFNGCADLIEGNPFFGIPLDPWEHVQLHVFIGISSPASVGVTAWVFTLTDPLPFYHMYLRAAPFDPVTTPFFPGDPAVFHGKARGIGAGGVSVFIIPNLFEGALIAGVNGDEGFLEPQGT